MRNQDNRNRLCFGMGTIGRDMFYSFEANTILYFLSDVLGLQRWEFAAASLILSFLRIFDAVNDPITGLLIDNIRSPWGKFKPAILVGGLLSSIFFIMLFCFYRSCNGAYSSPSLSRRSSIMSTMSSSAS